MLDEYRLLFPYLRRYRWAYVLGGLCIVLSIATKLLIPDFLRQAFDALERALEQGAGSGAARGALLALLVKLLLASGTVAVLRTTSRLALLGTSRRVAHDLRELLFDHLLRLAPSFFVRNPTGQIMSRCINDMQNVQGLMGPVILYLAETAVLFVIAVPMMVAIDPLLTAIALAPFPLFLFAARKLAVRIQEESRAAQNSLGEVSAKVDESLSGQMVIKTLTLEQQDLARFRQHCGEYRRLNLGVTRSRALLIPLMVGLVSLSTVLVLAVGGPRVVPAGQGPFTLGAMAALLFYLGLLAGPTRTLGFVISSLRRGAAALGRVGEILASEPTLRDPARPHLPPGGGALVPRGAVEVRDLSVVHPPLAEQPHLSGSLPELPPELRAGADRERVVLEHVSLAIPAGTTLGVVGHTGCGKTTLVRAIARMLEVAPGHVFIDGVDVTAMGLSELRRNIGFVPQDAFLFSATLAENVALGRADAPRAEVERAVGAARLEQDLAQLPLGLETLVGERGVNLSGGQRQRAALARVLLLAPKVLILDDTLSAVDTHTADEILAHLKPFAAERTTILVAHRLSTVQHAEQIVVLDEGRVVERGTHAELLAKGGIYADLWERQERHERSAAALGLEIRGEEV